jgi:hypothetical protein
MFGYVDTNADVTNYFALRPPEERDLLYCTTIH